MTIYNKGAYELFVRYVIPIFTRWSNLLSTDLDFSWGSSSAFGNMGGSVVVLWYVTLQATHGSYGCTLYSSGYSWNIGLKYRPSILRGPRRKLFYQWLSLYMAKCLLLNRVALPLQFYVWEWTLHNVVRFTNINNKHTRCKVPFELAQHRLYSCEELYT